MFNSVALYRFIKFVSENNGLDKAQLTRKATEKFKLVRKNLIDALLKRSSLPAFKTDNTLGDYERAFERFDTATDVKTKILFLDSNPKGYNLDKILEFLSREKSVFLFYFVGLDFTRKIKTSLVSMFQWDILNATHFFKHCAGRNSRGLSQIEGHAINKIIEKPSKDIDENISLLFLKKIIDL